MIISLVVAAAENNVIGKNNKLLWHLPNDMKYFKNITWPLPVLMGRKTFEAIGSKPLKGRRNIVITRQGAWKAEGVTTAKNIDVALSVATRDDVKELYIIGGGEIYKESIGRANRIYMTRIHTTLEGDTFFPAIDEKIWKLVSNIDHPADEKHAYSYSFQLWERK